MNVALRQQIQSQAPRSRAAASHAATRIEILDDVAQAESVWRRLEREEAILSPYQRYDWVRFWHRHVSPHFDTRPLIVVGYDAKAKPTFLWPLARGRLGPLTVATFFGAKHATLNLPPWSPEFAARLGADELHAILGHVTEAVPDLDLILLLNQPEVWNGLRNPFCLLPHQRAVEDNFRLTLGEGGSDCGVGPMPRRLRKKENQLAKIPGYRYVRASSATDVERFLDAFFVQKAARLAALGFDNVFDKPGIADFIRAACHEGLAQDDPVIELHALEGNGELLALFAGIHDRRRFTLAFNSHTLSDYARFSPGLVLLHHVIANCADRGFEAFDVGPGDARYKTFFCKEVEPIIDSVVPLSRRGHLAAPGLRAFLGAKSIIKRNPRLWNAYRTFRRIVSGRNANGAAVTPAGED